MASYDYGKNVIKEWVERTFPKDAEILDVGACDGKYRRTLNDYPNMDAVEVFPPNAKAIQSMYREVFCENIVGLKLKKYDLIIFGDVIEHLTVEDAKKVLRYAKTRCKDMIVAVPFLYPQGPIYGNPYEEHLQPDLTHEIFMKRYPGFAVLYDTNKGYCYYHKRAKQ